MTFRTNQWPSGTVWLGVLATIGSACMGRPIDFLSDSPGAGGDSEAGGTGGDTTGVGGVGGNASGGTNAAAGAGGDDENASGGTNSAGIGGTGAKASGGTGAKASGGTGGQADAGTGGKAGGGTGTTSGTGGTLGGTGGALVGSAGAMDGGAGEGATDPYAPRSGSFKALVYSETNAFRHESIPAGRKMLTDLASQLDFEVTLSEDFSFTAENLASYELVVFLNTTGDILDATEEAAFEHWMISKHGAFVGTHSAADTENGWSFYSEVTGQYFNSHTTCCPERPIVWQSNALDFPAVKGLPSPWFRPSEWFLFNDFAIWSAKPGFRILGTVQIDGETQPVSFAREFSNFRSFYTSLGHDAATFEDDLVRRHIAGGLLWAVRREHLLD